MPSGAHVKPSGQCWPLNLYVVRYKMSLTLTFPHRCSLSCRRPFQRWRLLRRRWSCDRCGGRAGRRWAAHSSTWAKWTWWVRGGSVGKEKPQSDLESGMLRIALYWVLASLACHCLQCQCLSILPLIPLVLWQAVPSFCRLVSDQLPGSDRGSSQFGKTCATTQNLANMSGPVALKAAVHSLCPNTKQAQTQRGTCLTAAQATVGCVKSWEES